MQINKNINTSSYEKDSNNYVSNAIDECKSALLDYIRSMQVGVSMEHLIKYVEKDSILICVSIHELITDNLIDGISPYNNDDIFGQCATPNMFFYYASARKEN